MNGFDLYRDHLRNDIDWAIEEGRFDGIAPDELWDAAFVDNAITGNGTEGERPEITYPEQMFLSSLFGLLDDADSYIDDLARFRHWLQSSGVSIGNPLELDTAIRCWLLDEILFERFD